jgi:vacuolar-type H+-ATPase subunit H
MDDATAPGDGDETTEDLIAGTRQAKEAAQEAMTEAEQDAHELQADLDDRAEDKTGE